ncbi:MAG: flagellar motor protein MotB [Saprospirales bacterium]|nr:flagellar motor protein MotB [Saprospirales bacterium]MBK8490072.1 flagellar motor protein MotB [Saprospirales bacterium]
MRKVVLALIVLTTLASCVGKKKYSELQIRYEELALALQQTNQSVKDCKSENDSLRNVLRTRENEIALEKKQVASMQEQMDLLKKTNTNLLDRMSDLSIVSKTGAESIQKSLESINQQNKYIQDLTGNIQRKDSLNLALVTTLKRSLDDVNDEDVQINVKGSAVLISISDKMLFKSGSSEISNKAGTVLSKVAKIINDQKELNVLVEGHTDNVPIKTDCVKDNWDLSAKRATSIVRTLQTTYNVDPARMTAGGRSEFVPKASNDSPEGRSVNRRTEIILTPRLDQFFELLAPKE